MERTSRMDKSEDLVSRLAGKKIYLFVISLILLTYVVLGFLLKETVFFGYDMPRVGLQVQDYLARGTYMTSQYFFSESTWQNVAWGPALIFFYALLVTISADPITISYLLTLVNILGIASVIILGWKFFSPTVGILGGALLAFNPYWFTYIRIIYQPSPLTLLLPIAMLLHFMATKSKPIAFVLLPIVWIAMFQIYLPTVTFIAVSFVFLAFYFKKSSFRYLLLGSLISLVLVIPSVKFYKENPLYIERFFSAPKQFSPNEKSVSERSKNVFLSFIQIPVGGMFKWQTGYSYNNFIDNYLFQYSLVSKALSIIFILSLIWNLYYSIRHKDPRRGVIVAWSLCSLVYLSVLWTSSLPPRYYLISFPPAMILIALLFDDTYKYLKRKSKLGLIGLIIPTFILLYWVVFNIQFNNFVKRYNYPYGWLHDVAETPYIFVKNTIEWVIKDSDQRKCHPVISNDPNNPNFGLWMEFEYSWRYVYKKGTTVNDTLNNCYYLVTHNDYKRTTVSYKQFGPFVALRND